MSEIKYGTPDVTIDREKYVGGSDIPVIMNETYFNKTIFDLAREKAGLKENDFQGNKFTEYGNEMESKIRDYINSSTEIELIYKEGQLKKDNLRGNFDGIDEKWKGLLEIKTSSSLSKNFDNWNLQIQFYLYLLGWESGLLAFYRRPDDFSTEFDENRLEIEEIEADKELQEKIVSKVDKFWKMVEMLKNDPFLSNNELSGVLYGKDLKAYDISKIEALQTKLATMKEVEKELKEEKEKLLDLMKENGIKKLDNEKFSITVKKGSERKSLNNEKVEEFIMQKNDCDYVDDKFYKVSKVKESLLIKLKGEK